MPPSRGAANVPAQPAASAVAPWLPRETATIQILDKVNAQSSAEPVKVGKSVQYGSITVLVRACVVRPNDRPSDAAAYLEVTDSNIPTGPVFAGWMLRSEPSLSMLEHPIYDLRIMGCTA
jgi:hypothetical protein